MQYWCDDCNSYSAGASPGKLQEICGYLDAVQYALNWCGPKGFSEIVVRDLAEAKGLPERAGVAQIRAFFNVKT